MPETLIMQDKNVLEDASQAVSYNITGLPVYANTERLIAFAQERTRLHWHEEIELVRILEGSMIFVINENYVELSEGDFLFINARQMHWTFSHRGADCRYNIVQVIPSVYGENQTIKELLEPVFTDTLFSYLLLKKGSDRGAMFTSCIDHIISTKYGRHLGYELEVMQDVYTIIRNLFYFYTFEDRINYEKEDADRLHFQNMIAYIYSHYREKITLAEIAESAHICRSKCCRLFQRFRQMTPIEFVNSYRIDQGARMLRQTNEKVARIAQECGFSQQSYFNRLFLKSFNCTPVEYRRRAGKPLTQYAVETGETQLS